MSHMICSKLCFFLAQLSFSAYFKSDRQLQNVKILCKCSKRLFPFTWRARPQQHSVVRCDVLYHEQTTRYSVLCPTKQNLIPSLVWWKFWAASVEDMMSWTSPCERALHYRTQRCAGNGTATGEPASLAQSALCQKKDSKVKAVRHCNSRHFLTTVN